MKDTEVKITLNTSSAQKSLKDLQAELKQVKNEMVNLDEGSKEFNEAANRAGNLKHQIDEINNSVRGAATDFGDMVGQAAKVGAGLTGAFQAAQGAMNLFGVESEEVTEAIKKMQSIMAITSGLSAIDNGIKSFKKLKVAIQASTVAAKLFKAAMTPKGLLAISAAVTAISVAFSKLKKNAEESNEVIEKSELVSRRFNTDLELRLDIMKRLGVSEQTQLEFEKQRLTQELANWNTIKERNNELEDELRQGLTTDPLEFVDEDRIEEITKRLETLKVSLKAVYAVNAETNALSQAKQDYKDINTELNRMGDGVTTTTYLGKETRHVADETNNLKNAVIGVNNALTEEQQTLKNIYDAWGAFNSEGGLYDSIGKTLSLLQESSLGLEGEWTNTLLDFQSFTDGIFSAIVAESEDKGAAIGKAIGAGFQAAGSMLNAFSDLEDKSTKEGFEKQKKLQISASIMNTLSGIVTALSGVFTTKTGPWDIALAATQATLIGALGAAQTAKIAKTKFGETGGSASTASLTSAASSLNAPVQYTKDVQGAEISSAITDTKVYVTETDISNTQNKVNVAESESRF